MDELDEFYFFESPLFKLLLLNSGKTEHVNPLFASRDEKGEFEMLFQELWDQPEKFFEYFRMRPATFEYILKGIEAKIKKFSNFRKCISTKQRLAVTLRYEKFYSKMKIQTSEIKYAYIFNFRRVLYLKKTKQGLHAEDSSVEFALVNHLPYCHSLMNHYNYGPKDPLRKTLVGV